jgi:hypothetical protein
MEHSMPNDKEFRGEIRVASRIVDYLSSGLYESPAASLKELVNNSFDADATRVDVFVKPDADRIIIEDNGNGMDRAEFEKHFSVISESHKRDESDHSPAGRPMIGKIGIGFIAANEICDVMEIVSTKAGSTELLEVSIRFDLMRQDPGDRRRSGNQLATADYSGSVSETNPDSHFTQVFLKQIRGEARSILAGAGTSEFASGKKSLYGLKPESAFKILKDDSLKTWSEFDAYSRNKLQIGLNVPVRYHDAWMPPDLRSEVDDIVEYVEQLDFALFIDGSEVRKPIVFNPDQQALISRFEFKGQHVAASGYFYAQHGTIRPQELQGLLIRIRNAAVGGYDPSFLGFSPSRGPLFQAWISGEIMADDRLEDAMNIDRQTLRIAHPAYVELQDAVHKHVADLIKRVRSEIYGSGTQIRRAERAKKVEEKIIGVATRQIAEVAPVAAKEVRKTWVDATSDEVGQKRLLRKFSVDQLYELVVEVAKEILTQEQLNEFLSRLTERLRR